MNNKKKVMGISIILIIVLLGVVLFGMSKFLTTDYNKRGTDKYYLQVVGEGTAYDSDPGEGEDIRYNYNLPAYDSEGNQKDMEFTAAEPLTEGAFLVVYYRSDKGVTTYEEIQKADLPKAVAKLFK